jgi:myo-inositol-1(or 4)-monophosphatase
LTVIDQVEDIARKAGDILLKYFHDIESADVSVKSDGQGLVTKADTEAEKLIIDKLRQINPNFGFLAEESGEHNSNNAGRWIIDPLDGTSNFAHGLPFFAVSIGFEATSGQGDLELGVIYNPVRNEMFSAVKGQGATLNGSKLSMSSKTSVDQGMVATGFYYHKGSKLREAIEIFERVHQSVSCVRRIGSAAMDLAYLAAGRFDAFWERGLSPWDVAAGVLIVREAGGQIAEFDGSAYTVYGETILAASESFFAPMQNLIRHQ